MAQKQIYQYQKTFCSLVLPQICSFLEGQRWALSCLPLHYSSYFPFQWLSPSYHSQTEILFCFRFLQPIKPLKCCHFSKLLFFFQNLSDSLTVIQASFSILMDTHTKKSSCKVIYCLVKECLIEHFRVVVTCCVMELLQNNKSLCLTIQLVV